MTRFALLRMSLLTTVFFIVGGVSSAMAEDFKVEPFFWSMRTKGDQVKYTPHFEWGKIAIQGDIGHPRSKDATGANFYYKISDTSRFKFTTWVAESEAVDFLDSFYWERFGYEVYEPFTPLHSRFQYVLIQGQYELAWIKNENHWVSEVYWIFGVEYLHLKGYVTNLVTDETEVVGYGNPVPIVGLGARGRLVGDLFYDASFSGLVFKYESPHYHTVISNVDFSLRYEVGRFSLSSGYKMYNHVVGNEIDLSKEREFHANGSGPYLGVGLEF